jgi:hypothetical protein
MAPADCVQVSSLRYSVTADLARSSRVAVTIREMQIGAI